MGVSSRQRKRGLSASLRVLRFGFLRSSNGAPRGRLRSRPSRPASTTQTGGVADQASLLEPRDLIRQLDLELERTKRGRRLASVVVVQLGGVGRGDDRDPDQDELASGGVIERAAAVLIEKKREIDVVGSFGEGKFVLILPETDERGALAVAERLRAAIADAVRDREIESTASFGVASFGRHGRSSSELLGAAERASRTARALERESSLLDSGGIAAATAPIGFSRPEGSLETMLSLAETADVRDRGASGHSEAVGRYARLIAREFGLPEGTVERIRLAGIVHDIGKVGLTRSVLQKPGPLSDEEWEAIRKHPEIGARMLEGPDLADVREAVLRHHERPDGQGYPDGLTGGEIPLAARIVAVAEAYEAMTSDRVHQAALSHAEAQVELKRCAGTQFDRRVVDAFMRLLERQALRVPDSEAA
jgi:two-component system, cell cycle response regulator